MWLLMMIAVVVITSHYVIARSGNTSYFFMMNTIDRFHFVYIYIRMYDVMSTLRVDVIWKLVHRFCVRLCDKWLWATFSVYTTQLL